DAWRKLWESARAYSEREVYPNHQFPHATDGARCVLCQQSISADAGRRMAALEQQLRSDARQKADEAAAALRNSLDILSELAPATQSALDAIQEVELESAELAMKLRELLNSAESSRLTALLNASQDFAGTVLPFESGPLTSELEHLVESVLTRTQALSAER